MTQPTVLRRGLEAQDWVQTASITADWERWGKFGRGAMYLILQSCRIASAGQSLELPANSLWFSDLHEKQPRIPVSQQIFEQVVIAGLQAGKKDDIDTQALLIGLMDL